VARPAAVVDTREVVGGTARWPATAVAVASRTARPVEGTRDRSRSGRHHQRQDGSAIAETTAAAAPAPSAPAPEARAPRDRRRRCSSSRPWLSIRTCLCRCHRRLTGAGTCRRTGDVVVCECARYNL